MASQPQKGQHQGKLQETGAKPAQQATKPAGPKPGQPTKPGK